MGKSPVVLLGVMVFMFLGLAACFATPSTEYWTPCVMDIQPNGKLHFGYDSYVTIGKRHDKKESFPNDYQLEYGIQPFEKLQMEFGVDLMEPQDDPLLFNAKIGTPENSLFQNSPGLDVGIFNVGTKHNVTDYNIVDIIAGKTLPFNLGRLHAGYYHGNPTTLRSGDGKRTNQGAMVAYDYGFYPVKDAKGNTFNRFVFAADWATGKNVVGGGGPGIYYYFTPDISLLTGPVWFTDKTINGHMKWTLQLDANF